MSHNCNITIDNSQNPDPLVLTELRDFKDTSNTPDGKFENVNPSNATIAPGLIVPANESLSFDLKRDLLLTSGATMNWTTGRNIRCGMTAYFVFQKESNLNLVISIQIRSPTEPELIKIGLK